MAEFLNLRPIKYFRNNRLPWMIVGIIAAIISILPYVLLGEASVITYHDQLDGELVNYMLLAKHLFDKGSVIPEIMNGIDATGISAPAPFFVLLFKLFKPFTAFVVCTLIVRLVSVLSMFLFLEELTGRKMISIFMAGLFMLLPFYTVYGLCIPGQPFLWYTCLRFRREDFEWPLYFGVFFYAICSSLALGGYAVLFIVGVWFIVSIAKKEYPLRIFILGVVLFAGYMLVNIGLVSQAFGGGDFVSHKSELVHTSVPFFTTVKDLLLYGANYTESYQMFFIPVIFLALILGVIFIFSTAGDKDELEITYNHLVVGVIVILFITTLVALLNGSIFVNFVNSKTGILHDFNFTRFTWLLTVAWLTEFALALNMLWLMADNSAWHGFYKVLYIFMFVASFGITIFHAVMDSDFKSNIVKLYKHGDYYMMTWEQFYAEDLFEQVDELIGKEKEDYRVVSLGIYPAAATYNGFYSLDAYSNNYDVEYKHAFREVIADELDKSEYLANWFDEWGNRCYIVLNESMNYFTFEKRWTPVSYEYDLNLDALYNLGCRYIVSASYLMDADTKGLTLLNENEEAIQTESSWYRLYVYEID